MDENEILTLANGIKSNIKKVIIGKDEIIDKLLTAVLCGGHILLEDMPGTGKTTLAKALARSIDGDFKRIQFTPDLLPSDVTGMNVYNMQTNEFSLKKGPVFTNILLADEINRATPRTQSSLLECMEEQQVTIDGKLYSLDRPFLVLATQNPIETSGTFPLPEAQLDRFLMRLSIGYPSAENERSILSEYSQKNPFEELVPVCKSADIKAAQDLIRKIIVSDAVCEYIINLVTATREDPDIKLGVSPRGSLSLMHSAQAFAALQGENHVLPDYVKAIAIDVLSHRILIKGANMLQRKTLSEAAIKRIIDKTPVPIP